MVVTNDERREVAARLRGNPEDTIIPHRTGRHHGMGCHEAADRFWDMCDRIKSVGNYDIAYSTCSVLADLIEPSYKPDAEYEAWYDGLSHPGDGRGGPAKIRELIEEIVWTALTVDLGPNGNTDQSTWIDEGDAYTGELFDYWEREVLRLTGGCDRSALLTLASGLEKDADNIIRAARNAQPTGCGPRMEEAKHDAYEWHQIACCIREALGVQDA